MAVPADDVAWALRALRDQDRQRQYRLNRRYYSGLHELNFATEKFRNTFGGQLQAFADNLCAAVVDSVSERLKITGVSSTDTGVETAAAAIWARNRMDVRASETHHESLLTGDGYALVWPNATNEAVIWSIPSDQMAVSYDPEQPGVLRRAARVWWDPEGDRRIHLDIYYPDHVERYAGKSVSRSAALPPSYDARQFSPWELTSEGGSFVEQSYEAHSYKRVPVIHFPNRRYHCYGVSELENVTPLQDALNKAVCDMLVAMEFSAYRQRWATGLQVEVGEDGKPINPPFGGADRIITSDDPGTRFGDFSASDLTQFVEVQENLRSEIARVSGTPLHYLFITRGDFPSGEAMKAAEARFTHKVENRQTSFGNHWEDALALALVIEDRATAVSPELLTIEWEDASPLALEPGEPAPTHVLAAA